MESTSNAPTYESFCKILYDAIRFLQDDRKKILLEILNVKRLLYNTEVLKMSNEDYYRGYAKIGDNLFFPSVISTKYILVSVGHQLYLEMSLEESQVFCREKIKLLKIQVESLIKKISEKRAHLYILQETMESLALS